MNQSKSEKLVEIHVSSLERALEFWDHFLNRLGHVGVESWDAGRCYRHGPQLICFVQDSSGRHAGRSCELRFEAPAEAMDELLLWAIVCGCQVVVDDSQDGRRSRPGTLRFSDLDGTRVEVFAPV